MKYYISVSHWGMFEVSYEQAVLHGEYYVEA